MDFTKPGVVGLAWEFPGTSRSRARECTGPWWGNRVMTWNLKLLWNWIWFSFYFTWAEHFSYLKFVLPLWLFFVFWGAWDQRPGAGGVVLGCGLRKGKMFLSRSPVGINLQKKPEFGERLDIEYVDLGWVGCYYSKHALFSLLSAKFHTLSNRKELGSLKDF